MERFPDRSRLLMLPRKRKMMVNPGRRIREYFSHSARRESDTFRGAYQ
jgi:hypothetical protein